MAGDHDGHVSNPFRPDEQMACPCIFGDTERCWCKAGRQPEMVTIRNHALRTNYQVDSKTWRDYLAMNGGHCPDPCFSEVARAQVS